MASINEILELVRAGYTRAEIDAMTSAPAPEQAAPPDEAPEQSDPPESTDAPDQEAAPAWATALQQTLSELRATIQASNRSSDEMDDEFTVADTAEAALAEYITGKKQPVKQTRKRG